MNERAIIETCAERGLAIEAARTDGLMLQLVPSPDCTIPAAAELNELATLLCEMAPPTRWVTLVIEQEND